MLERLDYVRIAPASVLDLVLAKLAEHVARSQSVKDYLVTALIYPVILTLTSAASMFCSEPTTLKMPIGTITAM